MAEQKTWSLAACALTINGINISAGAGTGAFFKVTPRNDWRTVTVGVQGDAVVNEMADHSADFELTMLQTSDSNKALSALANRTVTKHGDVGVGALLFEDLLNSTEISGDAVLVGPPEFPVQGDAQNIVWKGVIINCDWQVGGRTITFP